MTPAPSVPPSRGLDGSTLGVRREQQRWRERAVRGLALSMAPCFFAVSLWYAFVDTPGPELFPVLAIAAAVLAASGFARGIPFAARTALTLASLYVPATYTLIRAGYGPNPFVAFGMIAVVGTLLVGRRAGIALLALGVTTLAAVSFGHNQGLLGRVAGWTHLDSSNATTAVRVIFIFTLLTTTLVIAVSYLLRRSEDLMLETERSLETLRQEQAERERMARELELREAAFHKARELELLGRLAGSMAHDFNNALLVMWAALDELALLPELPEATQAPLADLRTAADQAFATTRQLRAFGPMAPRRPSELALTPLFEKAKTMFSRVLPQSIALELDIRVDAFIVADEGELLRVLMNLALNARDAMRDGGKLVLRVRAPTEAEKALPLAPPTIDLPPHAGVVVLEVEDNGSGMTPAVKDRIFEPFFTTKQASGTGLGLASVRDVVVLHGGRIEVASESGAGTTLSLVWPSVERAGEPTRAATAPNRGEPAVVLLVDDDDAVRFALRRSLTRAGLTVLDAGDGASALTLARRHQAKIHVLCTDCMMSGLPIRKLVTGFRELHRGKVLVCSGYAPAETGLTPEVFDDFLPKPFNGATLVERVHALLR